VKLNYIDWYLVELRRRLLDSMPLDQESSFILETKNHLESLTEEFVTNGMDPRAAEVAAIERFGTPDKIASDCILGIRRVRERRLIQFTTVMLGIFFSNMRGYPYASVFTYTLAPLIIVFGLYALVLGKLPARQWFVMPAVCIALMGIFTGFRSTYYDSPGTLSTVMNYRDLHDQYEQLRTQNLVAVKTEHDTADKWRALLATAKDMKSGETVEIPRIIYEEHRNHSLNNGGYEMSYEGSYSPMVFDEVSNKTSFRFLPAEKTLQLKGPLTAHDVRSAILGRITEVQSKSQRRNGMLLAMQRGLNISVRSRIQTYVSGPLAIYMCFICPVALLVSFMMSKIRNRIRFREKNLRLA
jgi:hypothetical protein